MRERREQRRRIRMQMQETELGAVGQQKLSDSAPPTITLQPMRGPVADLSSSTIASSSSSCVPSSLSSGSSLLTATNSAASTAYPFHSRPSSAADWWDWLGLWSLQQPGKSDSLALKWAWKDQLSPIQRRLVLGVNAFFLLLYMGGLIISSLEGWAVLDGVNYILSSWCTLGYGLYTPTTVGGRLFLFCYWPIGFVIISSTSTTIWRVMLSRVDRDLREKLSRAHRADHMQQHSIAAAQHVDTERDKQQQQMMIHTDTAAAMNGDGVEGDVEDGQRTSGLRPSSYPYPALKDIVFSSPSDRRHSQPHLSPLSTIIDQDEDGERKDNTHLSERNSTTKQSELVSGPDQTARDRTPTEMLPPAAASAARPLLPSPSHTAAAAGLSRRLSARVGGVAKRLSDTPTARYPLFAGRGRFALTVYEAMHEPDVLSSLADLFTPLQAPDATSGPVPAPVHVLQAGSSLASPAQVSRPIATQQQSKDTLSFTPTTTSSRFASTSVLDAKRAVDSSSLTVVPVRAP